MSCPKHLEISAYVDDAMAQAERRRFSRHLLHCPVCQARLEVLQRLGNDLRALPSPSLGFDLGARLEGQLRTGAARNKPARISWFGWGAAGLAVTLSLASGVWLGGLLIGGSAARMPVAGAASVFDPVPPGGLCAAPELCRVSKGMQ